MSINFCLCSLYYRWSLMEKSGNCLEMSFRKRLLQLTNIKMLLIIRFSFVYHSFSLWLENVFWIACYLQKQNLFFVLIFKFHTVVAVYYTKLWFSFWSVWKWITCIYSLVQTTALCKVAVADPAGWNFLHFCLDFVWFYFELFQA